jgi:hypothetical protein
MHQAVNGKVELQAKGWVENFPRKEKDAMDLTKLALDVLLKERKKQRKLKPTLAQLLDTSIGGN